MKVVLIAVVSLDGRIALPDQPGPGFASTEDQAWFRQALGEFDCGIMGRVTFDTIRDEVRKETRRRMLRVVVSRTPERHQGEYIPREVEFTSAAPADVVDELARRGHRRCALLGGGQIYREYLNAGVVDALWLTLEPVLLGGGTPLLDGDPLHDVHFRLGETRLLSPNTLLLNYQKPGEPLVCLPHP